MKKIISTLTLSTLILIGFAQKTTVNSVADGSWLMPTTWDCSCIPTPGSNINVNNNVVLNTNWAYSSGIVNISSGASLVKDNSIRTWAQNGGSLTNDGTFEVDRLAINAGSVTNSNTLIVNNAYYNGTTAILTNTGLVKQVDSLQNNGIINNNAYGQIEATKLWNNNSLINDGRLVLTYFLNTVNFTNNGTMQASNFLNTGTSDINDSVIVLVDFMNTGILSNATSNPFLVSHDFLNGDSLAHDALFINDGAVFIANDFTNLDTLRGTTGYFCIASYSANAGYIKGTIDICDQTPMSGPPYIDINTGTIGTGVTSCTHSCSAGIAENKTTISDINVYPNPFDKEVTFEFDLINKADHETKLIIVDILGQQVFSCSFCGTKITVDGNNFKNGVYFYSIENGPSLMNGKLISE
jgi:hypothetical protein